MTDKELLLKCKEALNLWLHTYAPDLCDENEVKKVVQFLFDKGGTLWYIANLNQEIDNYLNIEENLDEKSAK